MRSGSGPRAGAALAGCVWHRSGVVTALIASLVIVGCTTDGQPSGPFAQRHGVSVAFESIDGPPTGVFHKYVQSLDSEAQARQIGVVSREGKAQYRIRGYLAVHVLRGSASVAWVWDIYDADQRRAIRISGEEPGGRAGQNAWAAVDDATLRRIAQAGMDGLARFLTSSALEPTLAYAAAPALAARIETGRASERALESYD